MHWTKKLRSWWQDLSPPARTLTVDDQTELALLPALLPYRHYDDKHKIFINPRSKGFILEALPLTGANEETVNLLTTVLTDLLPAYTDIQFLLYGSPHIGGLTDAFVNARRGAQDIYTWLAQRRADYLISNSNVLRDIRLFITVSVSHKHPLYQGQDLCDLRERLLSTFKSAGLYAQDLPINNFISLIRSLTVPNGTPAL